MEQNKRIDKLIETFEAIYEGIDDFTKRIQDKSVELELISKKIDSSTNRVLEQSTKENILKEYENLEKIVEKNNIKLDNINKNLSKEMEKYSNVIADASKELSNMLKGIKNFISKNDIKEQINERFEQVNTIFNVATVMVDASLDNLMEQIEVKNAALHNQVLLMTNRINGDSVLEVRRNQIENLMFFDKGKYSLTFKSFENTPYGPIVVFSTKEKGNMILNISKEHNMKEILILLSDIEGNTIREMLQKACDDNLQVSCNIHINNRNIRNFTANKGEEKTKTRNSDERTKTRKVTKVKTGVTTA